jgi:hypothetical protein
MTEAFGLHDLLLPLWFLFHKKHWPRMKRALRAWFERGEREYGGQCRGRCLNLPCDISADNVDQQIFLHVATLAIWKLKLHLMASGKMGECDSGRTHYVCEQ